MCKKPNEWQWLRCAFQSLTSPSSAFFQSWEHRCKCGRKWAELEALAAEHAAHSHVGGVLLVLAHKVPGSTLGYSGEGWALLQPVGCKHVTLRAVGGTHAGRKGAHEAWGLTSLPLKKFRVKTLQSGQHILINLYTHLTDPLMCVCVHTDTH